MKNIVYLAWGSLLWDQKYLKLDNSGWKRTDLELPLEFSRISDKGRGRLTLVVDSNNGTKCKVWVRKANTKNLNIAIRRLMRREGTTVGKISYYNAQTGHQRANGLDPEMMTNVRSWCHDNGYDAVVWTGLETNWERFRGKKFTVNDALNYFKGSYENVQANIVNYIYNSFKIGQIKTRFSDQLLKFVCKSS